MSAGARRQRAPRVLVIAGSDPSGGAGLQGDLASLAALGAYALAVPSALTAQTPAGVRRCQALPADLTRQSITRLRHDFAIDAIKIGMLLDARTVAAVASGLGDLTTPLVLDPVLGATRGTTLSRDDLLDAICIELLPRCTLLTPNIHEATALCGWPVASVEGMIAAAQALRRLGPEAVLVKGGHLAGEAVDVLCDASGLVLLRGPRLETARTHGTGCALSTTIAHFLACGCTLREACVRGRAALEQALACDHWVGRGLGAVAHAAMTPSRHDRAPQRSVAGTTRVL